MKKWLITIAIVLLVIAILGVVFRDRIVTQFFAPTESSLESEDLAEKPEVVASNLVTPWSITLLPDGDMLVTEREGRLQRIGENGVKFTIEGVRETSEGGLLGVALSPDFESSRVLYVYYTTDSNGELTNKVDRYVLVDDKLEQRSEIIANIPAASNHNGGAIAFGPNDKLYITTGDAAMASLAQDTTSLAGKILRLNADGSVPSDNPFDNPVWSYGHRNPQGVAWDNDGRLWAVEHGPSGSDELNLIVKGENYGWPTITGDETQANMHSPVVQSGADETWAPSGMAYMDGYLYFAGLRGQSLYKADISDVDNVTLTRLFTGEYGRLRAATAHDGGLYFSTSNHDGRGSPAADDDRILRLQQQRYSGQLPIVVLISHFTLK